IGRHEPEKVPKRHGIIILKLELVYQLMFVGLDGINRKGRGQFFPMILAPVIHMTRKEKKSIVSLYGIAFHLLPAVCKQVICGVEYANRL
ncbi:14732_t:CDS:2, partial [Acaulospora morrowiae]